MSAAESAEPRAANGTRTQFTGPLREAALCDGCMGSGECRIGMNDLRFSDEGTYGEFVVPHEVEGRNVAHGGWTAWLFDEVLGSVPLKSNIRSVTAEMTIRYHRPAPLGAMVVVRGWIDHRDGHRWHLAASMSLAGTDTVLATAEGVWVVLRDPDAFYGRIEEWARRVVDTPAEL